MKKINYALCVFLSLCCLPTIIAAQTASYDKTPVIRMGHPGGGSTTYVTYGELKKGFNQGGQNNEVSLQDLESFLPLYANYIAKLKQANGLGYAEDESIISEYGSFADQAAISYWLDRQIKPTKFEEYYTRTTTEINAKHVLISVAPNASPADTLAAYNRLLEARELFLSGTSMDDLNIQFSSTRQGQYIGGPLPWFSVGDMIKEFEDVAYSLDEGSISMPFRTQFGYHIVHIEGRRDRIPARSVSHIYLRRLPADSTGSQLQKANQAYKALQDGRTWKEVVDAYSEDTRSLTTKGNIGWITPSSRFHASLLNAIMRLDPTLDYSQPIQTSYGYHILKIDSVETYSSEEERRSKLLKGFDDVPYYTKNEAAVFEWVNGLQQNTLNENYLEQYTRFLTQNREAIMSELSGLSTSLLSRTLYTINETEYSVSDFHTFLQSKHDQDQAKQYSEAWLTEFLNQKIKDTLVEYTRSNYPEFEDQLINYKDGLVVYKITEDSVWSSDTIDPALLRSVFTRNKELYTLPERKYFHMVSARNDSLLQLALGFIDQGNDIDSLEQEFDFVSVFTDSLNVYDYEPYTLLDNLQEGTRSEAFDNGRRRSIFFFHETLPERLKTFEEAFDEVFVDYQPFREEAWLKRLTDEYGIKLDYKNLRNAYEQEKGIN